MKLSSCLLAFVVMIVSSTGVLAAGQPFVNIKGAIVPDFNMPYNDIGLDAAGNIYMAIIAGPETFTVPEGGYDTSFNGGVTDIVVAKYEAETGNLLGATYIGGSGDDWCRDLAVDDKGNILLTGKTASPDFPTTVIPKNKPTARAEQAFVIKLDKDLQRLKSSILLGSGEGLAVASGRDTETLVAGRGSAIDLPVGMKGYDSSFNGGQCDVFVAKLGHDFTFLGGTLLGGKGFELPRVISQENDGDVLVAGYTESADFPVTSEGFAASRHGRNGDIFITRFAADLRTVKTSLIFGGSGHDIVHAMVAAEDGSYYMTGLTSSADFPTSADAFDTDYNGGIADFFVARISADFETLIAATFVGGSGRDWAFSLAVDADSNVYVAGDTESKDFAPVISSQEIDIQENGGQIVLLKLDHNLEKLQHGAMLGEKELERVPRLGLIGKEDVFVAGTTGPTEFKPQQTIGMAGQNQIAYDLFVRRFASDFWQELGLHGAADNNSGSPLKEKIPALGKDFVPAE